MPILKNAKKALRRDQRRTTVNLKVRNRMKLAVKAARDSKDASKLPAAYQAIDRAQKKNLLHKNKAARMKSQLAKLSAPTPKQPVKPKAKKTVRAKGPSASGRKKVAKAKSNLAKKASK